MSNSSLAAYIGRGSGNYNTRTELITRIVIHTAKLVGDCDDLMEMLIASPSASFHYGIATDGTIGLYIDERNRAWATGDPDNDNRSISIMVCNSSLSGDYPISAEAYQSLLDLCADICRRNFITELKYTGKLATSNLVTHSMFANVNCPGAYVLSKYSEICRYVNNKIKHPLVASQTEAAKAQANIIVDPINPYMITVDPGTLGINYNNYRIAGVVGVMFKAGEMFDTLHNKAARPINPSLKQQVAEAHSAYLPYALYWTARARTIQEVNQECADLWLIVSKYPPKLGIWLNIDFAVNASTNNSLMERYYKYIYKWGLKDKCGIYCNRSQLNRITWTSFSSRFSLWLIAHESSLTYINHLQYPNYFKL